MKKIALLDTSIGTLNIGDKIIIDSINKEMKEMFKNNFVVNIPTHDKISNISRNKIANSDFAFFGGTNALSSNMNTYNQWKVNLIDSSKINNVILLGVGWWQYQKNPNLYTKILLNRLLSSKFNHSVRDNYTKEKLNSIGIKNVINTGCPTLWSLVPDHCRQIRSEKGKKVIFTLTDYNRNKHLDEKFINILIDQYEEVYMWIQGSDDYEYAKELNRKIKFVNPSLVEFDKFLNNNSDADYIGTRLHGGIRAMQNKIRSIIIGIDNRALEMGKDFNLNILDRNSIEKLSDIVNDDMKTDVKLNMDNINMWKNQFR